jgi:hypothetical protein
MPILAVCARKVKSFSTPDIVQKSFQCRTRGNTQIILREQQGHRLLPIPAIRNNGACHPIGDVIEYVIGEFPMPVLARYSIGMPVDLLFETCR